MLLMNTDLDPLDRKKHPKPIDGLGLLNKNIKFVPLLLEEDSKTTSKIVILYSSGEVNDLNNDNENMSLLINVYCPFKEWLITGDDLRPFSIMSEVRKCLQDVRINGLGEIKYLGFNVSTLTEEMGAYTMRFFINSFA